MTKHPPSENLTPIDRLRAVMDALRDPEGGCPWDLEQDFVSISRYTIEEAYEVADAIARADMGDLREELGDLLLQVVFHSRMAQEGGSFTFDDVAAAITDKMIRRHPHVFGEDETRSASEQTRAWEAQKAMERSAKAASGDVSALDGVALALPALMRAEKLQKRAARVGFDWTETAPIYEKLAEEIAELREAESEADPAHIEEELGDLLFVVANLARRLSIDPEQALIRSNAKFERRFRAMESLAGARGQHFASLDLDAQDALWNDVKASEREDR